MGDVAAIVGVVFLLVGIVLVALRGDGPTTPWPSYLGLALAIVGLGIEVVGAVLAV